MMNAIFLSRKKNYIARDGLAIHTLALLHIHTDCVTLRNNVFSHMRKMVRRVLLSSCSKAVQMVLKKFKTFV